MPSQFSFCLLLFIVLKSKDFWQVKAQKNCSEAPTKTLQMACKMLHAFDEKSRVKWTFLLFDTFNSKHFCLLLNVILWAFFIIKNLKWKSRACCNRLIDTCFQSESFARDFRIVHDCAFEIFKHLSLNSFFMLHTYYIYSQFYSFIAISC